MPPISADTIALPRVADPDPAAADRPVRSVTSAPSGLEGEGFPVRRAFAGVDLRALDPSCTWTRWARWTTPGGGGLITDGDTQWMTAGAGLSMCQSLACATGQVRAEELAGDSAFADLLARGVDTGAHRRAGLA
jgi:hypothetical protein